MENSSTVSLDEIEVTTDEIKSYMVSKGVKPVTAKRILAVVGALGIGAFVSGTPATWNAVFHKIRPETQVDLGRNGVKQMQDVAAWIKGRRFQKKTEILEERKQAEKAAKDAERAKEKAEAEERRLNPEFTVDELEAIVILMRQCHLDGVDLRGARGFLNTFKIYPKPGVAEKPEGV